MKQPKVLSVKIAKKLNRAGVLVYGVVQSVSRGQRMNHTVVRRGLKWLCSCEGNIFHGHCHHIEPIRKATAKLLSRRAA